MIHLKGNVCATSVSSSAATAAFWEGSSHFCTRRFWKFIWETNKTKNICGPVTVHNLTMALTLIFIISNFSNSWRSQFQVHWIAMVMCVKPRPLPFCWIFSKLVPHYPPAKTHHVESKIEKNLFTGNLLPILLSSYQTLMSCDCIIVLGFLRLSAADLS